MSILKGIKESIESIVDSVLTGWTPLAHTYDINKNKFTSSKQYGVLILAGAQTTGVNCNYTMDQRIEIVYSMGYITAQNDDSNITLLLNDCYDDIHSVFKECVKTRCGGNIAVLSVNDLEISEPELYPDQKFVTVRARLTVKYRVSI